MYTPQQFKVNDLPTLHADMERWNFATLITPDAGDGPQVTHLPLLLDRQHGRFGVLAGHMARANPHWRVFSQFAWESRHLSWPTRLHFATLVTTAISPCPPGTTWRFTPSALPRLVEGTKGMVAHLNELIRYHEGTGAESWRPDRLPADTFAALLKGIVCFDMRISRIEGKAKLGQNRSRDDVLGTIAGLQATDGAANRELIKVTRSRALAARD